MNEPVKIPTFATEAEEAEWWFQNCGKLEEQFLKAARGGRLNSGSTALRRARQATRVDDINRHKE